MRIAEAGGLRNETRRVFLRKYQRLIFSAGLSIMFLGSGTVAAGLLYGEENGTRAILLFLTALLGAGGCIFSVFCCLRQLSPKPKEPYISTLHINTLGQLGHRCGAVNQSAEELRIINSTRTMDLPEQVINKPDGSDQNGRCPSGLG